MAGQTKQPTRNRKIEPLNWAETANSPALKGMMSFLDIKPEEVRSGHFKDVPAVGDLMPDQVGETRTGSETRTARDTSLGSDTPIGSETLTGTISLTSMRSVPPRSIIAAGPQHKRKRSPAPETPIEQNELPDLEQRSTAENGSASETLPVSETPTDNELLPVSDSLPMGDTLPVGVSSLIETAQSISRVLLGAVPSQNRKIRRCRLSQDAHSAGEEMLYRILWEEGKPETSNPMGSRIVRIGYAELANKSRMHKANVRLNLANLTAKLAIEQTGHFNSRDMIAKAYRVLSYKEILDRRRAAGLEYVIRQKNVVFVSASGQPISLPGLVQKGKKNGAGKSYQSDSQEQEPHPLGGLLPVSETNPVGESHIGSESQGNDARKGSRLQTEAEYLADLAVVSKALNTYWTVDDLAAEQLMRSCKNVRADAQAEEIAFFVLEKLDLTRSNRSINNPVGLILATVPQSFSGYSFDTFRQRRLESKRLAEQERLRKEEEDRSLREWMVGEARKTLADPKASEKRRAEAEGIITAYDVAPDVGATS